MKNITMIETYDNAIHANTKDALNHLNNQYSDVMRSIVNPICDIISQTEYKFLNVSEFIDNNLGKFKRLMIIKEDMNTINEDLL